MQIAGSVKEQIVCAWSSVRGRLRLKSVMRLLKIRGIPSAPISTGAEDLFFKSNFKTSRPLSSAQLRVICRGQSAGNVGVKSAAARQFHAATGRTGLRASAVE